MKLPSVVADNRGRNLHRQTNHPIQLVKDKVLSFLLHHSPASFCVFEELPDVVDVRDNFDMLCIPENHPSRSATDTFYVGDTKVLRTHTTAHQHELLQKGHRNFVVVGPVYRNDEVDRTHFPVFTQLEGFFVCKKPWQALITLLGGLVQHLFPGSLYRFDTDYFPFTEPSLQVEVRLNDRWLEILGAGVVKREIMDRHGINEEALAFGLGLDRLAMTLFEIPDIRLLWSTDQEFLDQFTVEGATFKPYSTLKPIVQDMSFYVPETTDKIDMLEHWEDESVSFELFDKFVHPASGRTSVAYHVHFKPLPHESNPAEFTLRTHEAMTTIRRCLTERMGVVHR